VQMALALDDARSEDLTVLAENHVLIVDAIARADVNEAIQVMRRHLTFDKPK
jgi:DNA-binding FadR family transcriptional regulator